MEDKERIEIYPKVILPTESQVINMYQKKIGISMTVSRAMDYIRKEHTDELASDFKFHMQKVQLYEQLIKQLENSNVPFDKDVDLVIDSVRNDDGHNYFLPVMTINRIRYRHLRETNVIFMIVYLLPLIE